jgi:YfiH family protein
LSLLSLQDQKDLFHYFGLKPAREERGTGSSGASSSPHRNGPVDTGLSLHAQQSGSMQVRRATASHVIQLRQVHSDRIRVHHRGNNLTGEDTLGHDAVISDEEGVWLQVVTADCLPLLLYDPLLRVAGAAHAGWRGSVSNIAGKAVRVMQKEFGCRPENLLIGIGPSIGPCCYEVGKEVMDALAERFRNWESLVGRRRGQKGFLDLWEMNRQQLVREGVAEDRIFMAGLCTYCQPDLFFSYRREGSKAGRMFSGLVLQKSFEPL